MALFMNPIEASFVRKRKADFIENFYPTQTVVDVLCQLDALMNFFVGYSVKENHRIEIMPGKIAKYVYFLTVTEKF